MNSEHLSERLRTVAKYVPAGSKVADIGSDHAYLPLFLVKQGKINFAIAGEVAEGPYQSAKRNVRSEGMAELILVRKGNGLEVVNPNEVDCITIAGMGGALISSILEAGKHKLQNVEKLILQPNLSAISIRKWFLENQWELVAEEILEEDGKIYEVLVGVPGDAQKPYRNNLDLELLLGPFLLQSKTLTFRKKWLAEMENWQKICQQLENAPATSENVQRRQELLEKIHLVQGVLN